MARAIQRKLLVNQVLLPRKVSESMRLYPKGCFSNCFSNRTRSLFRSLFAPCRTRLPERALSFRRVWLLAAFASRNREVLFPGFAKPKARAANRGPQRACLMARWGGSTARRTPGPPTSGLCSLRWLGAAGGAFTSLLWQQPRRYRTRLEEVPRYTLPGKDSAGSRCRRF